MTKLFVPKICHFNFTTKYEMSHVFSPVPLPKQGIIGVVKRKSWMRSMFAWLSFSNANI